MTAVSVGKGVVEAYLDEAVDGHGRTGARLALDLLDRGVPSDEVIVELLAAAQREVGERWWRNDWTIADEHLATGVSQKALDAVANTVEPPAERGHLVVACAEGDWHSLPAQMFAELLRSHGYSVAFLGASTPADTIAGVLRRHRPDALAVSCTVPLFFQGVTRLVDAAHGQGIPVIAGGFAFAAHPDRAMHLGADAWAVGIEDAVTVLRAWQHAPPTVPSPPTPVDPLAVLLDARATDVAAAAFEQLRATRPEMASLTPEQVAHAREDLENVTRFVVAARLADDPTVLSDFLGWHRTYVANRSDIPPAIDAGLAALAPIIAATDPRAGQLALDAIGSATLPP